MMITFLMNNWGSILVGTILAALIIGIIIKLRRDKKQCNYRHNNTVDTYRGRIFDAVCRCCNVGWQSR